MTTREELRIGGIYKTRDGFLAHVVWKIHGPFPMLGYIERAGGPLAYMWSLHGEGHGDRRADLIDFAAAAPLALWRSHKLVEAGELRTLPTQTADGRWFASVEGINGAASLCLPGDIFARGMVSPGDFIVRYDGGTADEYWSWSPRDKFLAGYRRDGMERGGIVERAAAELGGDIGQALGVDHEAALARGLKAEAAIAARERLEEERRQVDAQRDPLAGAKLPGALADHFGKSPMPRPARPHLRPIDDR